MATPKRRTKELKNAAARGDELTTAEAAAFTGYSRDHVALMVRKRILKGSKRGRDWFVNARGLLNYIASNPKPGRRVEG